MKIKYTQKRIKSNLGYGILMIGVGLFAIYEDNSSVFNYFWIVLGVLQAGTALYEKKNQYLTIDNAKLTKYSFFPTTIEIKDITKIRKFLNSYKIETPERTIKIDKDIIDADSLHQLENHLNSIKIKV